MTIETKYNIGDEVWMTLFDKPKKFVVKGVEYVYHTIFIGCYYYIKSEDCQYEVRIPESELFPTKEELLKSL